MKLEMIEDINTAHAERLRTAGIYSIDALFRAGVTPEGRQDLSEKTGIDDQCILNWVNQADLMRIRGIGEEYSDLLGRVGVDTVDELAQRNPDKLYETMIKVNTRKRLVGRPPSRERVARWVERAKILPRAVL